MFAGSYLVPINWGEHNRIDQNRKKIGVHKTRSPDLAKWRSGGHRIFGDVVE